MASTEPWSTINQTLVENVENYEAGPGFLYKIIGERYVVYESMPGIFDSGTLVSFPNRVEAGNALRALYQMPTPFQPLHPVRFLDIGDKCAWVVRGIYISFEEWARTFRGNTVDTAGNRTLKVFRQITQALRRLFLGSCNCFANLLEAVGINQNDEVVIIRVPQGGRSFANNIFKLVDIAQTLIKLMGTVVRTNVDHNPTVQILSDFQSFIGKEYFRWLGQRNIMNQEMQFYVQMFAFYHPASLDQDELLRLFINLGRLADDRIDCLSKNQTFFSEIQSSKIRKWKYKVAIDGGLNGVLGHNNRFYHVEEITVFCDNAMKHHFEHDNASSLSKKQVLNLLCRRIRGLENEVYKAYSKAVINGSYRHKYSTMHILTESV